MKTTLLTAGSEPYAVTACVVCCGSDIAVVIGGGAAPHIGAVLCRLGHKDDQPAREAALYLASRFNTNVTVTVGLHLDEAGADDIAALQQSLQQILHKVEDWLLSAQA